jgi:hypothetical protein
MFGFYAAAAAAAAAYPCISISVYTCVCTR